MGTSLRYSELDGFYQISEGPNSTMNLISASLFFLVSVQTHNVTVEDLLKFRCEKGNQKACQELQQLHQDKERIEFLYERVDLFAPVLAEKNLMLDEKRPNLAAAYPLVMEDYIQALNLNGTEEQLVSKAQLEECGNHYHHHWINKKLWWPSDEGRPDWQEIYVFVVDHYYGYCLRRF